MRSRILTSDYVIRVGEVMFDEGDVAKFDITGDDLGNGFTDTSCHAGWYTDGKFSTSYNGGPEMQRTKEVGCAHPTEPEGPTIYPTGKAKVVCNSEWGRMLIVEQLDPEKPLRFEPEVFDGPIEFDRDGIVIRANGVIKHMKAGDSLPAPKRQNLVLWIKGE